MSSLHLGVNLGHDRSAAIVSEGEILVAIEQERLDRHKHSTGFMLQGTEDPLQIQAPHEAIHYCLEAVGACLSDLTTITGNMPGIDRAQELLSRQLSPRLGSRIQRVPSHHLAHAYSAFSPSGFEEAIVLVADASGSTLREPSGLWTESYTLYRGRGARLEPLHAERVKAHLAGISTLGFVYDQVSRMAGFLTRIGQHLEIPEAGKLMGLAAYGGPQEADRPWFRARPGDYSLDIRGWEILLECQALKKRFDSGEGALHMRQWVVDLAWKVQDELERALCHLVETAMTETGLARLCLAGGVALNSVANHVMVKRCGLEDLFVFPAAGDNGIAAGCALWAHHEVSGSSVRVPLRHATLGRDHGEAAISRAIELHGDALVCEALSEEALIETCAEALAKGRVVARYGGGSEFGPRALGHRSILADPSFPRMKDVLNARVKHREAFRPFAPVVPEEEANAIFDLEVPAPFMLVVPQIRPEHRGAIPAVVHEDGTGRVQTTSAQENPFLHTLCRQMVSERGGLPVVLNTSFNVAGQPIVETPEEAIATFLSTDMDHLALGGFWITRRGAAVRDYADHLQHLEEPITPSGLEPGRSSVEGLMEELDAAIFQGRPSAHWSPDELAAIASQGAHLKEGALSFPECGLISPLRSQITESVVLLLDPMNGSRLVDLSGEHTAALLTRAQADLLLGLVDGDHARLAPKLRAHYLADLDWAVALAELSALLEEFGVAIDMRPWSEAQQSVPWDARTQTFAAFSEASAADDALSRLGQRLRALGYNEEQLSALLGVSSLQQIEPTRMHWLARWHLDDSPLSDLARLFLLRASVPPARLLATLGEGLCACLVRHGLVVAAPDGIVGRVDLFPVSGLLVFTDHRFALRASDRLDESPVMYIGLDSLGLAHTAPREPVQSALDLCCGSGVQGLIAAQRYAKRVTAVDVNPRAQRFARGNAALNAVRNYEVLLGDLYDPVAGQRFELILANPPFVPSPEEGLRFRDGGARGEEVLARIIDGADAHLEHGGRVAIVSDLVSPKTLDERLDFWWGAAPSDRLVLTTAPRDEILFSEPHARRPFGQSLADYQLDLDRWVTNFRAANLGSVDFGYILIWRRAEGEGHRTTRIVSSPTSPVHDEVARWKRSMDLWSSGGARALKPKAGLSVQETRALDGRLIAAKLSVPLSPFFTSYAVDEETLAALYAIDRGEPCEDPILSHLVALGLIEAYPEGPSISASPTPRPRVERREIGPFTQAPSGPKGIARIRQSLTKTTPTCLSSYLS
ncbi:MAG: carbamoyltransferase C-terminal domain-containing protein [Myxococcota bacterium]